MPTVDTCSLLPFPELSDESGMKKSTPIRCSLAYFLRSPPRVMLPSFHVYPFTFSCVVFQALALQFLRVKLLNASYWKWRRHSSTYRSFLLSSRAFSVQAWEDDLTGCSARCMNSPRPPDSGLARQQ